MQELFNYEHKNGVGVRLTVDRDDYKTSKKSLFAYQIRVNPKSEWKIMDITQSNLSSIRKRKTVYGKFFKMVRALRSGKIEVSELKTKGKMDFTFYEKHFKDISNIYKDAEKIAKLREIFNKRNGS